ncbi:phosphate-induced protein 1 conserved region-domain-containing protein [Zopfochytrium polystomum]|nr:phosphate-induced protein 1 conserved region-domain-containing protein [Zopfochytrium polystomum]
MGSTTTTTRAPPRANPSPSPFVGLALAAAFVVAAAALSYADSAPEPPRSSARTMFLIRSQRYEVMLPQAHQSPRRKGLDGGRLEERDGSGGTTVVTTTTTTTAARTPLQARKKKKTVNGLEPPGKTCTASSTGTTAGRPATSAAGAENSSPPGAAATTSATAESKRVETPPPSATSTETLPSPPSFSAAPAPETRSGDSSSVVTVSTLASSTSPTVSDSFIPPDPSATIVFTTTTAATTTTTTSAIPPPPSTASSDSAFTSSSSSSSSSPSPSPVSTSTTTSAPSPSVSPVIFYGGGPLLTTQIDVYGVFYGNHSSDTVSVISTFTNSVGKSRWWDVVRTYTDGSGTPVTDAVRWAGAFVDAGYSLGKNLVGNDAQSVVAAAAAANGWPKGSPNAVYALFLATDVRESLDSTLSICSAYCGYHTWNGQYNMVVVADATACPGDLSGNPGCLQIPYRGATTSVNNNLSADSMVNILAHELAEAATDYVNGWSDASGNENADLCNGKFGALIGPGYNVDFAASGGSRFGVLVYSAPSQFENMPGLLCSPRCHSESPT